MTFARGQIKQRKRQYHSNIAIHFQMFFQHFSATKHEPKANPPGTKSWGRKQYTSDQRHAGGGGRRCCRRRRWVELRSWGACWAESKRDKAEDRHWTSYWEKWWWWWCRWQRRRWRQRRRWWWMVYGLGGSWERRVWERRGRYRISD